MSAAAEDFDTASQDWLRPLNWHPLRAFDFRLDGGEWLLFGFVLAAAAASFWWAFDRRIRRASPDSVGLWLSLAPFFLLSLRCYLYVRFIPIALGRSMAHYNLADLYLQAGYSLQLGVVLSGILLVIHFCSRAILRPSGREIL